MKYKNTFNSMPTYGEIERAILIPPSEEKKEERVTDEMIHKIADEKCSIADEDEPEHTRIDIILWDGFVQGAKWLRDKYEGIR